MILGGIIGFVLGAICGISSMCLLQINASEEDHDEDM